MNTTATYCDVCGTAIGSVVGSPAGFCPQCGKSQPGTGERVKPRRFFTRYGLILGLVPWFLLLLYMGYAKSPYFKTAAVVNGQRIAVTEVEEEAASLMRILEEQGNVLTDSLRSQIQAQALESLINSALIDTEARRNQLAVANAELDQAVAEFRSRNGLQSDEDFTEFIRKYYGDAGRLRQAIRSNRLYAALLKDSGPTLSDHPSERNRQAQAWFANLRQSSSIKVLMSVPTAVSASGGCAGGCCKSKSPSGESDKTAGQSPEEESARNARTLALGLVAKDLGTSDGLEARILDRGCHLQVDVYSGNRLVKSYNYQNGDIRPL